MARKTRRQKQRAASREPALAQARPGAPARPEPFGAPAPARPATPAAAPPEPGAANGALSEEPIPTPASPAGAPAAPRTGAAAVRRRVERIVPGAAPAPAPTAGPAASAGRPGRAASQRSRYGSAAAMVAPLESGDPAIPFDRVPYVPADLRRVAFIALFMVVLILIAWFAVAKVTG